MIPYIDAQELIKPQNPNTYRLKNFYVLNA